MKSIKHIIKDLGKLRHSPPEDIQVIPTDDVSDIKAWIRGPSGTPYENGFFKVHLILGDDFPSQPPKGYFITKIFHPNVSASGEICLNTLKKDWKPDLGIIHILLCIKCLLIVPNPESALNEEAGKLLLEQYDDYARQARLYTAIHAKSGKDDYERLMRERTPLPKSAKSESDKAEKEETVVEQEEENKTTSGTLTTSDATKATVPAGTATTIPTVTTGSGVLAPSDVSNRSDALLASESVATTVDKTKRKNDASTTSPDAVQFPAKRSKATVKDKKKGLRRL